MAKAEKVEKAVKKVDAVRDALAQGIDKPQEAIDYIKSKYGIEMTAATFGTYKSQQKKKVESGEPVRPRGRPAQAAASVDGAAAQPAPTPAPRSQQKVVVDAADLAAQVKTLVGAHGADQVKRMVDVFSS